MSEVRNFEEQRNPNPKPPRHEQEDNDEEIGKEARRLALSRVLPSVLRSAIELGLIDALHVAAEGGGAYLSPSEIALRLPRVPTNPNAPDMLNRVLRLLAICSIVECRTVRTGESTKRVYRAKPVCRYLVKNGNQEGSFGHLLLLINDDFSTFCWSHLTEAILKGANPLQMVYGKPFFELAAKEKRIAELFNSSMSESAKLVTLKFLEVYKGFEGVNVLVDVGGGTGATLFLIAAKHSHIKAINFDLPHVVADAPTYQGIEHVGGDMFAGVPEGDAIILRNVLNDWNDEDCLKILKNCFKALPSNGKLIAIESVLSDEPQSDVSSRIVALEDLGMLTTMVGGKQRTRTALEALANDSGFGDCRFICCACSTWLIEFHK